ncbi:terminase small subunit [Spirosoma litoris]
MEATPETNPLDKLNARQRKFVVEYLDCLNQSEAARRAGYSEKTVRLQGHRLITNDNVIKAIAYLGEQMMMSAGEAVRRLTEMARGNLVPFFRWVQEVQYNVLTGTPLTDLNGNVVTMLVAKLDLTSEEAKANLHLLKKVKQGQYGLEIELNDPKDALDKILQLHGRYKQLPGDANQPKQLSAYELPDGTTIIF